MRHLAYQMTKSEEKEFFRLAGFWLACQLYLVRRVQCHIGFRQADPFGCQIGQLDTMAEMYIIMRGHEFSVPISEVNGFETFLRNQGKVFTVVRNTTHAKFKANESLRYLLAAYRRQQRLGPIQTTRSQYR